jgi:hypothetical protein
MSSTARTMNETSGSFVFVSGVGTQTLMTSHAESPPKSALASSRPERTASAISADGTSSMYERPSASAFTFSPSRSKPLTGKPAFAKPSASGRPT